MSELWFILLLSLVSGILYLWFSVSQQEKELTQKNEKVQSKALLLLPILFLLISPLGYYLWGNLEKQNHWLLANEQFQDIQMGKTTDLNQIGIQELLLALRTSIDQDQNNAQLWFILAENYFQLRMTDLADTAMQKAIEIEPRPSWFVANAQILTARSSESDLAKSVNLLQRALLIQPNHQSALLTLGFVYLRQQQFENAISSWNKLKTFLEKSGNDTQMLEKQIELAQKQLANKAK